MGATAHPAGSRGDGRDRARDVDRVVRTMVFVVPPAALVVGGWLAWGAALYWQDLLVLAISPPAFGGSMSAAKAGTGRRAGSKLAGPSLALRQRP